MRLLFKKGRQKELIELAKKRMTWNQLSKELGFNSTYIRNEIKNEKVLLDESKYKKISKIAEADFSKYIKDKLEENWGKIKGGSVSNGNTKKIACPPESKELAEFYGIMLGDGNITKIKKYKVGTYEVSIVGDSRYDKKYLLNYVNGLIKRLFGSKARFFKFKNQNALCLKFHSKELVKFLEKKELKSGNKIKNQLGIPKWIKSNETFLRFCLRGLYDTDGGIYKLNNQNVHQIVFTNYNLRLINDVRESLIILGIVPSRISKGKKLFITKKSEVRKFLKHIGFRNPKNLDKIKLWDL